MEELNKKNVNEVVEGEFTEVDQAVETVEEQSTETAEAQEPTESPDLKFLGTAAFDQGAVALGSTIITQVMSMLGETKAYEKFKDMDEYLEYARTRLFEIMYAIFPSGAITSIELVYLEESDQIEAKLQFNTSVTFDIYSDRVPVTTFVKVI